MTAGVIVARVGGVPFRICAFAEAVSWVIDVATSEHPPVNIRLANAWNVALADKDASYRALLTSTGVNLPDGAPITWFMNVGRRGQAKAHRVRGPTFFREVIAAGIERGVRHYLLGGSPETLHNLHLHLASRYSGVQVVGSYSPPFAPVDDQYISDCIAAIKGSRADIVWVGLGTPKQDVTGTALASALGITTINVGAAFDYLSGTLVEAPPWIQRSGFEWLFRLLIEPRRLWRRYIIGNIQFLWAAIRLYRIDRSTRD